MNRQKLNSKLLNNYCVKEEITMRIRKYFKKMNINKNAIYQNFWDAQKAVLRAIYW